MDAAAVKPPGHHLLQGKFLSKKLPNADLDKTKVVPNADLDKTKVVCTLCKAELAYCRTSWSLKLHLKAKHPGDNVEVEAQSTSLG